jgi:hypothetical protein
MEWPADQVERRPLAALIPSARNARTHSEEQIAQIAASIREWGWTMPILVDEAGTIIAGHGRVLAAARLGLDAVPVMVARGWSEAQKRAYLIADNKLGLNAGWNEELLRIEMADLMTGFARWYKARRNSCRGRRLSLAYHRATRLPVLSAGCPRGRTEAYRDPRRRTSTRRYPMRRDGQRAAAGSNGPRPARFCG